MTHVQKTERTWLGALTALILAAFSVACSNAAPTGTVPATDVETLTFPVTITLSTPSPLSPIGAVLEGSNSVQLGARASVLSGTTVSLGAGGLQTQPDATLMETWSRGTAALNDRVKIQGTLHAKTKTQGSNVSITTWDSAPAIDPVQKLSWKVVYPAGAANPVTLNLNQSQALAPGRYGVVTLNSGSTLTLRTGIYFLTTLTIQSSANVILDQASGPVIVYVTDSLALRGTITPLASGVAPDFLLAYLGTTPIYAETVFNGALIAPSAAVTLRSVSSPHTGFFAAKDQILDAGARVVYRLPTAVIGAAAPPGATCSTLLNGSVPPEAIPVYCKTCASRADTDRDGVPDCADACPSDPLKVAVGSCGCGVPDTDSDGDGTPDCYDQCPKDANNISAGRCGCVRDPSEPQDLAPLGTACFDPACPQTNTTCNGAGVCGNRNACLPAASGCKLVSFEGVSYWVCSGPVTESAARAACGAKQMTLARIDGITENRFLRRVVKNPSWIGANSITAANAWRWSLAASNDGAQFWSGGASGAQSNMLFSNWAPGAPGSQRCAVLQPSDGRWADADCTQALGYVCESPLPTTGPIVSLPPPGSPSQPPPAQKACVPLGQSKLPNSGDAAADQAQLAADYDAAAHNVAQGAAANPPPDGSAGCLDNTSADSIGDFGAGLGCTFTLSTSAPAGFDCFQNSDCTPYGASNVCRQVDTTVGCRTGETSCKQSRCGTLTCPPIDPANRCDQIEVCNTDYQTDFDAGLDPNSSLDAGTFDPGALFDGGLPTATPVSAYVDPSQNEGKANTWCFMKPQHDVPTATTPPGGKVGNSGGGASIQFGFHPDLKFDANVNPLSMGETKLDVHAQASLAATITISNFLGKTFSVDVLNAKADIHAERCTVRDDDTQFTVLGGDFIDDDSPFIFNTSEGKYADETKKCNDAVGKFITFSNRAKKAFRDAQQLLTQYRSLQNGVHFDGLCQQLMGAFGDLDVPLFPGGTACPANEPSEVTINRFLDYYQAPGFGQITAFRQAMSELTTATANLKKALSLSKRFDIADPGRSESENIASVQFAIGPIPMTLQIDTFYGYGVAGGFEFELTFPFDPLNVQVGQKDEIAHVKAGVMPHANAGLSAFVGAGGGLGGFNATLGIEGALTLGEIRAPIFAGAGVGAEVTQDLRPTPAALQAPVSAPVDAALSSLGLDSMTHFGIPTAFKFYVWYDYGAALDVQNVLSGEINARLRIKFFFFSRTWRKRIVKFNGWSFHFPLVAGKVGSDPGVGVKTETIDAKNSAQTSAPSVEGTSNMGLGEAQTTLPVLAAVEVPATAPTGTVTPFDNSQMKGAFYDNLCCSKPGEACPLPGQEPTATSAPCCPGESCKSNSTDPTAPGACVVACKNQGAACTTAQDCCDAPPNQNNVVATCDTDTNTCGTCINPGGSCKQDSDCCGGSGPNQFASCVDGAFCELNL